MLTWAVWVLLLRLSQQHAESEQPDQQGEWGGVGAGQQRGVQGGQGDSGERHCGVKRVDPWHSSPAEC